MDQDSTRDSETGSAAQAFGQLRAEISLLRRAIERLTDERSEQPDYGPSLEAIGKRLEDVCIWAQRVSERPAIKLTPRSFAAELAAAAEGSREADRQMLHRAADDLRSMTSRMDGMIERSRDVGRQRRVLLHNRIAFALAGMMLFAILPGAIARSLPASWAVPERIAARILRTDMRTAREDMVAKAADKRAKQTRSD